MASYQGSRPNPRVDRFDLTIGTPSNFKKETLIFEVVGFHGTYHAISGRPCYMKFMAIPNYTYLKPKMPGPCGIIIVGCSYQHAYECEVECCELTAMTITSDELAASGWQQSRRRPNPSGWHALLSPQRTPRRSPSIPAALTARCYALALTFPPNRKACSSTSST
jgi:hypothetical protein